MASEDGTSFAKPKSSTVTVAAVGSPPAMLLELAEAAH
jgi:hypothetical protein